MTTKVSTPESVFREMLEERGVEELARWDMRRWERESSDPRFWERLMKRPSEEREA